MTENQNQTERKFTQHDVDTMISTRLKEERTKLSKELEQRAQDLDRREALIKAKADWMKKGLPGDLLDVIDLTKENALETAENLLKTITAGASSANPGDDSGAEDNSSGNGGFEGSQDIGGDENRAANLRKAFGLPDKE